MQRETKVYITKENQNFCNTTLEFCMIDNRANIHKWPKDKDVSN